MHKVELNIMKGMVSVLNEALKKPILTGEQYEMRLSDLKEFEKETGFVFMNSPTCKEEVYSVVEVKNIFKNTFEKCNDIDSIIEFTNKQEMIVYPNINGTKVIIAYNDGIMSKFTFDNVAVNLSGISNVPYKINKKEVYIVTGVLLQDLRFYVTDVIEGGVNNLNLDLEEAKNIGFDVVPYWIADNLNPKNLQNGINYIMDYTEEEGLLCDSIVFRFNNTSYSKNGIVYEVIK